MWDFPDVFQLPLAAWVDALVEWLTIEGAAVFGAIGRFLLAFLLQLERFLLWLPWVVVIGVLAAIAWRLKNWRLAAGVVAGLLFIGVLGLWDAAMQTLAIVIAATFLALAV